LQIDFDFISNLLLIVTADNPIKEISKFVFSSGFYHEILTVLRSLGVPVTIWTIPVEVPDRTPFEDDNKHKSYDHEYAQRFWRILSQANRVFSEFRSRFTGKVSSVHFFWGAFDLAITRYSGHSAPSHPRTPYCAHFVMTESYSHEVVAVSGLAVDQSMNLSSMLIPTQSLRVLMSTTSTKRSILS
jgi:hypothetical protein